MTKAHASIFIANENFNVRQIADAWESRGYLVEYWTSRPNHDTGLLGYFQVFPNPASPQKTFTVEVSEDRQSPDVKYLHTTGDADRLDYIARCFGGLNIYRKILTADPETIYNQAGIQLFREAAGIEDDTVAFKAWLLHLKLQREQDKTEF